MHLNYITEETHAQIENISGCSYQYIQVMSENKTSSEQTPKVWEIGRKCLVASISNGHTLVVRLIVIDKYFLEDFGID